MTRDEFTAYLEECGYSYERDGDLVTVTHEGWVYLDSLTTML